MQKTEIYNEILKLDPKERKELFGAFAATFGAEELNELVTKMHPEWAKSGVGKTILGVATAILGVVAGYFLHQADVQLPCQDNQPAIVAPANIEE